MQIANSRILYKYGKVRKKNKIGVFSYFIVLAVDFFVVDCNLLSKV